MTERAGTVRTCQLCRFSHFLGVYSIMSKAFQVNTDDVIRLENELRLFQRKALPFAQKQSINELAVIGSKISKKKIMREFINRNKWTVNSIRYEKTRSLNVNQMVSKFGSIQDYMLTQEEGGTVRKQGKQGVPIPTSYAAGQSENTNPRTKLPRPRNTLRRIQLNRTQGGVRGRKSRNQIAIKQAAATGRREIYLDFSRSKGIFRVVGRGNRIKIKMIYDLSRTSVNVPKHPIIHPSAKLAGMQFEREYMRAIEFQIKRLALFSKR